MYGRIVGVLEGRDVFVPAAVILVDVLRNHRFDGAIGSLDGITMRSVCRRVNELYAELVQLLRELFCTELRSIIGEDGFRAAVSEDDLIGDDPGDGWCRCPPEWYQLGPFGEPILEYKEPLVPLARPGKWSYEIHGDLLPWSCRVGRMHFARGRLLQWFVGEAVSAVAYVCRDFAQHTRPIISFGDPCDRLGNSKVSGGGVVVVSLQDLLTVFGGDAAFPLLLGWLLLEVEAMQDMPVQNSAFEAVVGICRGVLGDGGRYSGVPSALERCDGADLGSSRERVCHAVEGAPAVFDLAVVLLELEEPPRESSGWVFQPLEPF